MKHQNRSGGWWSDAGIGVFFEAIGAVLEAVLDAVASGMFH